jgi:hypothetical protein
MSWAASRMRVLFLVLSFFAFIAYTVTVQDVMSLDLSRFVQKLTKNHAKFFPNASTAERGIEEYKKFFALIATNPKVALTPSYIVDEVWHNHILDTKAYMSDCDKFLGKYLHHNPGFASSAEEHKVFDNQYVMTMKLYRSQFGDPPVYFWPDPDSAAGKFGAPRSKVAADPPANCGNCGSNGCGTEPTPSPSPSVADPPANCGNCGSNGCGTDPTPSPSPSVADPPANCGNCGSNGCGTDPTPSPSPSVADPPANCGNCGSNGCGTDPTPSPS